MIKVDKTYQPVNKAAKAKVPLTLKLLCISNILKVSFIAKIDFMKSNVGIKLVCVHLNAENIIDLPLSVLVDP